ncbi:two-component system sensor histidine kinase SenX3 [soil metagenome]
MGAPLITISVALSVVAMVAVVVACLFSCRALRQRLETETSSDAGHLHEAEIAVSRLAGALDAIPQGVVICDDTGREVFRNQVAIAYVRSRHGEALVEQAIQEQFVAVRGAGAALRTLDLYGPPRRVLLLSAVDLRDGLQPAGALVLVDDVSERRRLEAVRRDFVVNITHELKTPVGALGLLADTIAAEDDAQVVRRLAERMTEEAFRVGRVIDDLLDLSRIEAEESPRRESVPVYVVVAEAVERVRPLAQTRGITIDADECARWHSVQGDHRQLVSAVANLLDNACKYSDEGSSVELRSRVEDGSLELEVCDHGIGIPGRDLERVFERFYRVDRARSRETGGTGLGLAIVRHVATNHKGEVRVTSREGEGSVFTLRLPSASQRGGLPPAALVAVPVKAELR